jgi:hypothetical protein
MIKYARGLVIIFTTRILSYLLHFVTIYTLEHLRVTGFKLLSTTRALIVMTAMTRPKVVATFKFDVTMSFVMTAQPIIFSV